MQTTLGVLYRNLAQEFNERGAQEYFKRGYNKHQERALMEALGKDYAAKNEAFFLPFVDSDRLENVKYLSEGGYGAVWSAIWNRPQIRDLRSSKAVPVALKQPKHGLQKIGEEEKFLQEVQSHFCAQT